MSIDPITYDDLKAMPEKQADNLRRWNKHQWKKNHKPILNDKGEL